MYVFSPERICIFLFSFSSTYIHSVLHGVYIYVKDHVLVNLIKMGNLSYDGNTKLVSRDFPIDTGFSCSFGMYACPTPLLMCTTSAA